MPPLRPLKTPPPKLPWHWYEYATLLSYLLVLTVFASGGFFVLKPRYDAIVELRQRIANAREQQRAKSELKDRIGQLIGNAQAVTAGERAALDYMLPKSPDLPGLFVQTEQLTQSSGMTLQSLEAVEKGDTLATAPAGVLTLPLTIKYAVLTSDPYVVLKQSLAALESNLRLFDVLNFTFAVQPESGSAVAGADPQGSTPKKEMEMKVNTYYFPQK